MLLQREVAVARRPRGVHVVTDEVLRALPELGRTRVGLLHLLLQHTSAAICLGENADPDVRRDLATWLGRVAPDGAPFFVHDAEGPDDMPAHIASMVLGAGLTLPVRDGRLALGTWQGIYLVEWRAEGGERRIVATLQGE